MNIGKQCCSFHTEAQSHRGCTEDFYLFSLCKLCAAEGTPRAQARPVGLALCETIRRAECVNVNIVKTGFRPCNGNAEKVH